MHTEVKTKKELSRTEAFLKDSEFYVEEDLGQFTVFGDNTGFAYKGYMDKEEADEYAAELNKNRKNHEF